MEDESLVSENPFNSDASYLTPVMPRSILTAAPKWFTERSGTFSTVPPQCDRNVVMGCYGSRLYNTDRQLYYTCIAVYLKQSKDYMVESHSGTKKIQNNKNAKYSVQK